jgi:hypothetical protein
MIIFAPNGAKCAFYSIPQCKAICSCGISSTSSDQAPLRKTRKGLRGYNVGEAYLGRFCGDHALPYNPQHMEMKRQWRWVAIAAIWLFFYLALDSMIGDSPTMDEQNHIARGLAYLRTGDPRLSVEHPPLVNTLSALPLLTMPEIELPLDHQSWERQPPDVFWYLFAEELLYAVCRLYTSGGRTMATNLALDDSLLN